MSFVWRLLATLGRMKFSIMYMHEIFVVTQAILNVKTWEFLNSFNIYTIFYSTFHVFNLVETVHCFLTTNILSLAFMILL